MEGPYLKKYGAQFLDIESGLAVDFRFRDGLNGQYPYAFEVPRDQFDADLLDHVKTLGVAVRQPEEVIELDFTDRWVDIKTTSARLRANYVVDATGRDALLGHN